MSHDNISTVAGGTASQPGTGPSQRSRGARVGLLIAVLLPWLVVGCVTIPFAGLSVMASDSCTQFDDRLICSAQGQMLLVAIPLAALTVGILLISVGGGIAIRSRTSLWPWLATPWVLLLVAVLTVLGIAGEQRSEASKAREATHEAREQARERADWLTKMRQRPTFEVVAARMREMQQRIVAELDTLAPPVPWPMITGDEEGGCATYGFHSQQVFGITNTHALDRQWEQVQGTVGRIAGQYGFTHIATDPDPGEPPQVQFSGPNGAMLRITQGPGKRLWVRLDSQCHVPARHHDELPR